MGKKVKLNVTDLKVQSFVTSLPEKDQENAKGGMPYTCATCIFHCSQTIYYRCYPTESDGELCFTGCDC